LSTKPILAIVTTAYAMVIMKTLNPPEANTFLSIATASEFLEVSYRLLRKFKRLAVYEFEVD
jgi:hypothetical protein